MVAMAVSSAWWGAKPDMVVVKGKEMRKGLGGNKLPKSLMTNWMGATIKVLFFI
jgi:hypothetical protein